LESILLAVRVGVKRTLTLIRILQMVNSGKLRSIPTTFRKLSSRSTVANAGSTIGVTEFLLWRIHCQRRVRLRAGAREKVRLAYGILPSFHNASIRLIGGGPRVKASTPYSRPGVPGSRESEEGTDEYIGFPIAYSLSDSS